MSILHKCNVHQLGRAQDSTLVFGHGLGVDQTVWRFVAPMFADAYHVILFDYVGCGQSQKDAFDFNKYRTLAGYAEDLLEVCEAVGPKNLVFVGHSVSAMVGVYALLQEPNAFAKFVMLGPSPCYIKKPGYAGPFEREDIDSLLATLRHNRSDWAASMGPALIGPDNQPHLIEEAVRAFAQNDQDIVYHFAQVTLLSDNRPLLPSVQVPTCIIQCQKDAFVPNAVGDYIATQIPNSHLVQLQVTGHCPQLVSPPVTAQAIRSYIESDV